MSKVLYYECFSGISGDMNLGAMVSLGVDKDYLINELSKLGIDTEYDIKVSQSERKGISGTKVDVILKHHHHCSDEHEEDIHSQGRHGHCHGHSHENINEENHEHEHHHHRNLEDINKIIDESDLNDNIKEISKKIFLEVAKAESKVHNKSLKEVHFHEVGATDSIVDIVGAAICLDYLNVDKIISSKVEVGSGFVECAHGILPVPAPATGEILKGIPITLGKVPFEATTPTGAAILKAMATEFTEKKDFSIKKCGYGIGGKDIGDVPNVLRVFLAEDNNDNKALSNEKELIIECNIDDMNPELYDYVMDKLFKLGALDVYFTPIIMKKNRPAIKVTVLTKLKGEEVIQEFLLKETTTLGVRKYLVDKVMLKRDITFIDTKYGKVKVKNSYYKDEKIKSKPEYDDCKRIAVENDISIKELYDEINKNFK